jgi:hypothetical protein
MGRDRVARQSRRRLGGLAVPPFLARAGWDFPFKINLRTPVLFGAGRSQKAEWFCQVAEICYFIAFEIKTKRRAGYAPLISSLQIYPTYAKTAAVAAPRTQLLNPLVSR